VENNQNSRSKFEVLKLLRKSIYKQAILALLLIMLTVVLLFAMTSAWYTNVVQTSGLMFEVAQWGFSGEITVPENAIVAGPGDDGGVYMTLQNDSDAVVDVSVYVNRSKLGEEMRKRLFFYVETSDVINEESVERIYLSNGAGYDYTVVGQGNLTLTESYHNDAPIKWEWVYDMLGYYVTGTLKTTAGYTSLDGNVELFKTGTVEVEEYLRPVEYPYDEAKTTFEMKEVTDEEGNTSRIPGYVETIDGTTTAGDFLLGVTSHDGYPGTVSASTVRTSDGFYPVTVDANTGYGVWLYLCDYAQIQAGIIFDTQQGENAAKGEAALHEVTLNVTAQKSDLKTTVIDSQAELIHAMSADGISVIQLAADVTLDSLTVPAGKDVVLDLNENVLHYSPTDGAEPMMTLQEGSSLTLLDGSIVCDNPDVTVFDITGADLTLSQVSVSDVRRAVQFADSAGNGTDSKVRLLGSTIRATDCAVYMVGNGTLSSNPTQLVIENSTIDAGYMGVVCNGNPTNPGNWGTDITIIDSTIHGHWTAVYHPQQESTMTIIGSELTGYNGIVLKGGTTTIRNCTITGTGAPPVSMGYSESGYTDTGDGVYLEANYDWDTLVEIYDSNVAATGGGVAVRKYEMDVKHANIIVYSGQFSHDVQSYLDDGSVQTGQDSAEYPWLVTVSESEGA